MRISDRRNLEFHAGDQAFLKLSPWRGVIRFRRKDVEVESEKEEEEERAEN
ncbi:hypothetical protein E5676_scaffold64G00100 [Cucumis melo var. makuwa]|uniref:Uncharacterized protein n=1 Tax=Cucumis melo var. makuwa TaxID=1194695 RepID=A0A5D3E0P6_CUCMM|nr:hypothetical protein E5676_scaffold64G00100 [Cucumis melo var. makuwa]